MPGRSAAPVWLVAWQRVCLLTHLLVEVEVAVQRLAERELALRLVGPAVWSVAWCSGRAGLACVVAA